MARKATQLIDQLLSPSGGLVWHCTAWRRRGDWGDFIRQLDGWLRAWSPPRQRLIIIGGSAGYTLPAAWLRGFDHLLVLDPDPVGRALWRARMPRARFGRLDALAPGGLAALVHAHPDAALLFANLLGQVDCPHPTGWPGELAKLPATVSWASFHEAFSTTVTATHRAPLRVPTVPELNQLVAHFWPGLAELALIDHGCLGLGGAGDYQYAPWSLRPGQEHLIEWCSRPAASPRPA